MRASVLIPAMILAVTACRTPALEVRPPEEPSAIDRILTYQESLLGLVAASETPEAAAAAIASWCSAHTLAIREAYAELELVDAAADLERFASLARELMERAEEALGPKVAYLSEEGVQEALEHCREPHD